MSAIDKNGKGFMGIDKKSLRIKGRRIYLRSVRPSDVNRRYAFWMNDPEVTKYLESRFETWSVKTLKSYIKKIWLKTDVLFLAIVEKGSDKHIGNIKIGPVDSIHKFADVGIIIGERSMWGKGYASETIQLAKNYVFEHFGIHKLTAGIYSNNLSSVKAFLRAGFVKEGIRKEQYMYEGSYVDCILLGCLKK